jgi:general secretion pathway protein B
MSFILDALRKSDAERQRAATPGLADVRYAPRATRRNLWLPVLVVVLGANALFLAAQWWRKEPAAPPAAAPATVAVPSPEPVAPSDVVAPAAIRPLAREAEPVAPLAEPDIDSEFAAAGGVAGAGTVPAPVVMEAPEIPAGMADEGPASAPVPAPMAAPAKPSRILPGDDLPTAEELMGKGVLNVPALNLDLHVYSDTPASRFVVINTRKYKEGGQLSEGPRVESITRDGVILSNQGRRFTLTRK